MLMAGQRWKRAKSANAKMQRIWNHILNAFFPPRCPVCDEILEPEQIEHRIHPDCGRKIYPVTGAVCMQCGRPLENTAEEYCYDCSRRVQIPNAQQHRPRSQFVPQKRLGCQEIAITQGKSLFLYQGAIKTTMYRFKYSNKREYAQFFAEQAVAKYGQWIQDKQIDVIVPVPMYKKKQRVRGYNQAETFARALSKLTGIPVDVGLVRRVKDTTPQKELNDLERKNNLKSAFQKSESIVQYSHILVVDDIYTTGSTAEAVAKELIKTKTCHVYFLSICIGKGM